MDWETFPDQLHLIYHDEREIELRPLRFKIGLGGEQEQL